MKIIKAIIWVGISFSILLPPTHAEEEISGLSSIETTYRASIDVRGTRRKDKYVFGFVFEDSNRDGVYQRWEKGIPGVSISNGQNVVLTNNHGRYRLLNIYDHGKNPTKPGAMTIFVTKPADYKVPVDKDNVPQFYYHHIPDGSPEGVHGKPFRFEGLPASGPLPDLINFPMIRTQKKKRFKILVSGDTQTYSNDEVGYVRDTLAREWSALKDMEALIIQGDVLGDDLSLFPRFKQALSLARTTQYYVPGNHDADFDAPTNSNSFDTFKREWGPAYYSFDIGDVHFVVMNDIFYPCTEQDNEDGLHDECEGDTTTASYNGIITNDQMQWLANDLARVPKKKLIVLNMHISIYSFLNQNFARDMVDNQVELIETLGCIRATDGTFPPEDCERPILALSGHTHTLEQIRPGEVFEGWETTLNSSTTVPPGRSAGPSPFPQIVTRAACGAWWSGDFNSGVVPEAWQISGAPRGYLVFEFNGSTYMDTFKATG